MAIIYRSVKGSALTSDEVDGNFLTLDQGKVNNTGNETIAGTKTFSSIPLLPSTSPSLANHAVRKQYVDDLVSSIDLSSALLVDGSNSMLADLDVGGNDIVNVGQINVASGQSLILSGGLNGVAISANTEIGLFDANLIYLRANNQVQIGANLGFATPYQIDISSSGMVLDGSGNGILIKDSLGGDVKMGSDLDFDNHSLQNVGSINGGFLSINGDYLFITATNDISISTSGTFLTLDGNIIVFPQADVNAIMMVNSSGYLTSVTIDPSLTFVGGTLSVTGGGGGTVSSVSGTTNRITSTGGTTPVIDISASYVGQSSITTLGTITTGIWNGTAIANANLANSSVTIGSTSVSLGATASTIAGLTLTAPVMTTPTLGVASATTINKVTITAPATGSTLTISDGKTLAVSNTLRFAGTDSTVFTFPSATDTVACLGTANVFTASQTISTGSTLTVASDTDATTILGRCKIGSPTTDIMFIAHFDRLAATDYALAHTAAGGTFIGSTVAGGGLTLSVGNQGKMALSATAISISDTINLVFSNTGTGTKIGAATNQKFAFWNKTPIIQPTTGITGLTVTANAGTALNDASTYGGYTIGQVVAALVNVGILA